VAGRSIKKHICATPVEKGYARKSKATRYAGGYLLCVKEISNSVVLCIIVCKYENKIAITSF